MKRTSILATLVATGLLGIAVLAPSSASANVLCSKAPFNYDCPAESTYGVGAEFHAYKAGLVKLNQKPDGEGLPVLTCGVSDMDMTVTNAGGPGVRVNPVVDITKLTFDSCGENPTSAVSDGTATIIGDPLGGSFTGMFSWSGEQIETHQTFWVPWGGKPHQCVYDIVDFGTLDGPLLSSMKMTTIVFDDALAQRVSGPNACLAKAYFNATYVVDNPPSPIYVLPQ